MDFPIIETENLFLRNIKESDANAYWDYVNDPDVKFKFRFNHTKESAAKRVHELANRYYSERPPFVWALASKKDIDKLIGVISIDGFSAINRSASLACGITGEYRSEGVGTEATIGLINYLFKEKGLHRLELRCTKGYKVSRRCFEKMGATYEGIARGAKLEGGKFVDSEVYSILADEWVFDDMDCQFELLDKSQKVLK